MPENKTDKMSWKFALASGAVVLATIGSAAMMIVQPLKDTQHYDAVAIKCTMPGNDTPLTRSFKNARVSGVEVFPQNPNARSFTVKETGQKSQKFDGNYCVIVPQQG